MHDVHAPGLMAAELAYLPACPTGMLVVAAL
jgi:hypothetical protein